MFDVPIAHSPNVDQPEPGPEPEPGPQARVRARALSCGCFMYCSCCDSSLAAPFVLRAYASAFGVLMQADRLTGVASSHHTIHELSMIQPRLRPQPTRDRFVGGADKEPAVDDIELAVETAGALACGAVGWLTY